jgi:hypothetical protein
LGDESQISGPYDAKGCEKKREFNPRWYKIVFDTRLVYGVYCLMPLSTIFQLYSGRYLTLIILNWIQ